MRCHPVGQAVEILTPFTFADGGGIEIFAQDFANQVLFFDDGLTMLHLHSVGLKIDNNRKRWRPLSSIANKYGVTLSDQGVFEVLGDARNPSVAFAKMVSTLLGVAAWEKEQEGVAEESAWLVDEVALYLKAWKSDLELIEKPTVVGFSGRVLDFDFDFDGKYIDAISPHSSSTGAELRKIVDLRSASEHARKEVMVIVDDRRKPESADQEIKILSRTAWTWKITDLMAASGLSKLTQ
jgi:hypothetical protein